MDVTAITPAEVRRAMEAIRQVRPVGSSPLLDLVVVECRMRADDLPDSIGNRERSLAAHLTDLAWQHLARWRGLPEARQAWLPLAIEREWLAADFATDLPDRQAWSCLYQRYCSPRAMRVGEIADAIGQRGSDPCRLVRRRMTRAFELVADALRGAEWEASNGGAWNPAAHAWETLARAHAGPRMDALTREEREELVLLRRRVRQLEQERECRACARARGARGLIATRS